jgi:hypothetical protein
MYQLSEEVANMFFEFIIKNNIPHDLEVILQDDIMQDLERILEKIDNWNEIVKNNK